MATVFVIYHSATGSTKRLAELIAEGVRSTAGVEAVLAPAAQLDYDAAAKADGYAVGSPDYYSYVAGSVKTFFDTIYQDKRFAGKPCVCFGTHGGGGKVLGVVENLARAVGFKKVAEGLLAKGMPAGDAETKAKALGAALGAAIAKK